MVAATLALLAFILAFTFGLAGSWFDVRRRLVIDEANAIGTTYLRAGMLPEPHRSDVRDLLREYVDVRLEAIKPGKLGAERPPVGGAPRPALGSRDRRRGEAARTRSSWASSSGRSTR